MSGLKFGQALIGDWVNAGLPSQKIYRNSKDVLARSQLAAFKGANKGTVATLMDSRVFSIVKPDKGDQKGEQRANKGRTKGEQGATNHTDTQNSPTTQSTFDIPLTGQDSVSPAITAKGIYAFYPRHVAKASALIAISKAMKNNDPAFLLGKVREYAEAIQGIDPKFIPYPAKWFNSERFNDDPNEWKARTAPAITPEPPPGFAVSGGRVYTPRP